MFLQEDVSTTRAVELYKPIVIVHLAAMAGVRHSLEDPCAYVDANVRGQANLLTQAVRAGTRRFVYASSSSVYGTNTNVPFRETDTIEAPNSPYAVTKKSAEDLARLYSRLYHPYMCTVGLRFFTVYGPRGRPDMSPFKFLKAIHEGEPLQIYGDASGIFRDFTYVGDVVEGVVRLIKNIRDAETLWTGAHVFNMGSCRKISMEDFISTCEEVVGRSALRHQLPAQTGDIPVTLADVSRAAAAFGYAPSMPLKKGLELMYEDMI